MFSRYRILFNILPRIPVNLRQICAIKVPRTPQNSVTVPFALGFSIFTWLGFEKKLSAEDDLIETIKHCVLFIQNMDYEKAEQLLHVALRQAQQLHHNLGITYIYDVMANMALEREQLDKAKKLFVVVSQRIMADGANEDDIRVIHLSAKLARISHLNKDYSTAQLGYDWCLEKLRKAVTLNPSQENKLLLAMTEDWYGRLFLDCNNYEQGLKYLVESLHQMREVSDIDSEHIVIQLNDIGTVCDRLDKTDESINYFKEAIELGKTLKMDDLGAMYVNLGRAYMKKSLIDQARKTCGYAWKLAVNSKNNEIKSEAESCIKEINRLS